MGGEEVIPLGVSDHCLASSRSATAVPGSPHQAKDTIKEQPAVRVSDVTIMQVGDRFVLEPTAPRLGGTAHVHRARDFQIGGTEVAVKLYDGEDLDDELRKECFLREREALRILNHPNVVRLVAAGYDSARGQHYIALEWLEQDLLGSMRQADASYWAWPHVARHVMVPLLQALGAAHARRIWHRDIKPSNVMVGHDGDVRLTDFGIAKLVDSVRFGMTVRDFHSKPYSPPEHRTDQVDERSDLYSLGVTVLRVLRGTDGSLDEHVDISAAMDDLPIPADARDFLMQLTAPRREDRPRTAKLALVDLERLLVWESPKRKRIRRQVKLQLTGTLIAQAQGALGVTSEHEIRRLVKRDIAEDAPALARDRRDADGWPDESTAKWDLVGEEFLYPCRFDADGSGTLIVLAIHAVPPSVLERRRDAGMTIQHEIRFDGRWEDQRDDADMLVADLAAHEAERAEEAARRAEAGLFQRWWDVLKAKTELEARREDPLVYDGVVREGRLVTFLTKVDVNERYLGQPRRVKMASGAVVVGSVVEVGDRAIGLAVERGSIADLPDSGQLLVDRGASRKAIDRQKTALTDVQEGESVRSDLGELLVHPDRVATLAVMPAGAFFQELDEPKQRAVTAALASPDFTVVLGPPGTGKTTFIAELIAQLVAARPGSRILLSSQTHVAVDNAAARLGELFTEQGSPARIVRVGRFDKIEPEARHLTVPVQLRAWHAEAEERARSWIADWGAERGIDDDALKAYTLAGKLTSTQGAASKLRARLAELEVEEERLLDALTDPERAAPTTMSTGELIPDLEDELAAVQDGMQERMNDLAAIETTMGDLNRDLAGILAVESLPPKLDLDSALRERFPIEPADLESYESLLALQDEWLLRFGQGDEFEEALLASAQVVAGTCVGMAAAIADDDVFDLAVVDEASKATPTEALMPMARSRRWVLVGDERQLPPFQDSALVDEGLLEDHGLSREDLRETIFGRLSAGLPADRRVTLTEQHRMIAPIGALISECFYDGELRSSRGDRSELASLHVAFAAPVTWLSTSKQTDRRERAIGTTYWNASEVRVIHRQLERLERCAAASGERLKVGVISGYGEQGRRLRLDLRPDDPRWVQLDIDVHPVDSFQGQERDVVIYSVTRSNSDGNLGFLASSERLNVALSRGKDALIIVGDSRFCARASGSPFVDVLVHVRSAPGCALVELTR